MISDDLRFGWRQLIKAPGFSITARRSRGSGLIRRLLWGVKENDPLTFVAVIGALLAVAMTPSVMPALRIRKLDPVSLLRSE